MFPGSGAWGRYGEENGFHDRAVLRSGNATGGALARRSGVGGLSHVDDPGVRSHHLGDHGEVRRKGQDAPVPMSERRIASFRPKMYSLEVPRRWLGRCALCGLAGGQNGRWHPLPVRQVRGHTPRGWSDEDAACRMRALGVSTVDTRPSRCRSRRPTPNSWIVNCGFPDRAGLDGRCD